MTKRTALFIVLTYTSTLVAQSPTSQVEPYGFQNIHLGMTITEFKVKHPTPAIKKYGPPASPLSGQALCIRGTGGQPQKSVGDPTHAVMRCDYHESYLNIPLQVSTIFIGGKLALIEVEPPLDTTSCFEPPPPTGTSALYFYSASCQQFPHLLQDLAGKLGPAMPIVSINENLKNLRVLRWENDSSVAEFQVHMCGPWDGTDRGWSKVISEILEGSYCGSGDSLSSRQPLMLYLHKGLSRALMMHLAE